MSDDLLDTVGTIGAIIVMVAVVAAVLIVFAPVALDMVGAEDQHSFEPDTAEFEEIDSGERPDNFDVLATTGYAVHLNGDAYVDSPAPELSGDWTVCTVVALDDDANQDATYDIVAIDNETITLRYEAGNWTARHIDDQQTQTSASAAASDPTSLTPICGVWDDTASELTLWAGGAAQDTSAEGESEPRNVAVELVGTVDETRMWDSEVADADLEAYASDPIQHLDHTNPDARLMFDEGEGDTARVFYLGGDAQLVGAGWTEDGVDDPGLAEDTDYEVEESPLRVRALSGGYLDGAPIAYAVWGDPGPFAGVVHTVFNIGSTALVLLVVGILAIAALAIREQFKFQ